METKTTDSAILEDLPVSAQNPLLTTREFFKYCKTRLAEFPSENGFRERLTDLRVSKLVRPVFQSKGRGFYSTFQCWHIRRATRSPRPHPTAIQRSELQLQLLLRIQDLYLPEARGNRRVGEYRDHGGDAVLGGTHFTRISSVLLSGVHQWRRQQITAGEFVPQAILDELGVTRQDVETWVSEFVDAVSRFDPLWTWQPLVRHVAYKRRQELRRDALLAQDLYEVAEMLVLFLRDLAPEIDYADVVDWVGGLSGPRPPTGLPDWKRRRYGDQARTKPYDLLEFLTNEYALNPKPRAIVFTEGDEWAAIQELYRACGFDPELLGIEFRSIQGAGNFTLSNWQCLVEYMHEKQVLVYFLVDREGRAAPEAKKMLTKKRKFAFPGLKRIIPARDRIKVWASSFEEANFTDAEIAVALRKQGQHLSSSDVAEARRRPSRRAGLIKAIEKNLGKRIDKRELNATLVGNLIRRRRAAPNVKRKRPVERFVEKSGRLILLNHQPHDEGHRRANFETGLMG